MISRGSGARSATLAAEEGATLWGAVLAPDGSRLPGAVVTLVRRNGGEARVAAGTRDPTAQSPGFAPAREAPIVLTAGESRQHDVRLVLAAVSEQLTVLRLRLLRDARDKQPTAGWAIAPHLSHQRDPFRTGVRVLDPGRSLYVNASGHF